MANERDLTGKLIDQTYPRVVQVDATGATFYNGLGVTLSLTAAFDGDRTVTRSGIPDINVGGETIVEFLNNYFFPAVPLTVSITSFPLAEQGLPYTAHITGTITPNDGVVTLRKILKGASVINNPSTDNINYTDSPIITNTTYTIEADWTLDSVTQTPITASASIDFYPPLWYGVGSFGLTPTQIQALTKIITSSKVETDLLFSPVLQRYYYAYPASFGDLTLILDQNGFNVTPSFIKTTATFTLPDSTTVLYNIYTSNANTTQTNFKLSFS